VSASDPFVESAALPISLEPGGGERPSESPKFSASGVRIESADFRPSICAQGSTAVGSSGIIAPSGEIGASLRFYDSERPGVSACYTETPAFATSLSFDSTNSAEGSIEFSQSELLPVVRGRGTKPLPIAVIAGVAGGVGGLMILIVALIVLAKKREEMEPSPQKSKRATEAEVTEELNDGQVDFDVASQGDDGGEMPDL
jgi:hypothetical protein